MNTFTHTFRAGQSRLPPSFIALLASQLENLALEPHLESIARHLMRGKSISEVAAITGEPLRSVMMSFAYLVAQAYKPQPPDAPQTVSPPGRPPRRPLNAAAELVFSAEESLSAVASVPAAEERIGS
jgi:hypothetical protein